MILLTLNRFLSLANKNSLWKQKSPVEILCQASESQ
jgi:hypothetical protein